MVKLLPMGLAILAGALVALQGTVNSKLKLAWGLGPALMLNCVVALGICAVIWAASGAVIPSRDAVVGIWRAAPSALLGGVFGAGIVWIAATVFGQLGPGLSLVLFLAGQFATAALVEHFALLGVMRHALDGQRVVALVLVLAGAWLWTYKR